MRVTKAGLHLHRTGTFYMQDVCSIIICKHRGHFMSNICGINLWKYNTLQFKINIAISVPLQ